MGPFLHFLLQVAFAFCIGLLALLATYPLYLIIKL